MSFTLFSTRKSEINNAIATIQAQITLLQQQLADQQAFLQEIGTVEQAGESALNQARTFLSMVRAIDPSQELVFWQAMDALKSTDMEALAPTPEVTEVTEEQETVPDSTGSPEPDTVEVTAVEIEETTPDITLEEVSETTSEATSEATEEDDANNQNDDRLLTYAELTRVSWSDLKKICIDRTITNPSGQRLTRKFAEQALLNKLRTTDILHLANYSTIIAN